jgi:hypothetical protein
MSGRCQRCGEHCLDCTCMYVRCFKCNGILLKSEKVCVGCLINETKELLDDYNLTFKDE